MENGIYTRREYQIILYEKEGAESFVVVKNDNYPDEPVVLFGDNADGLILTIATYLNTDDKEKEGS